MLEQKLNSEQNDETQLPSSPNNGNTHVVGSHVSTSKENIRIFSEFHPFDKVKLVKLEPLKKDGLLFISFDVNGQQQPIVMSAHQLLYAIKKHIECVTLKGDR